MAQELKIRVGLDSTRLFAGLRGVQGALASSVGSIARIASRAGAALAAIGAPLTAGAFAVGIKGALDLGGALSDMAARTGIAAGDLIVLQQAFKDSGLSAEQVGSAINRMQRSLFDASKGLTEPIRGLDAMGLEIDELMGLSPSEQFQKISQAISKIEDPTIRAAAAMQIFGRSGAELGALFSNPEAFEQAQRRLGSQAAILGKSADRFDAVSDIFNAIGVKIRGFFVGVADKILPALEKIAAVLDSIDLAPIGEKFGASLQKAANILTNAFRTPTERVAEIERQIAGLQDKRVKLQTEGDTDGLDALNAKLADLESRKIALGIDVDVDAVVGIERKILELEKQQIALKAVGDLEGLKNIDAEINRLRGEKIKLNADTSRFDTIISLVGLGLKTAFGEAVNFLVGGLRSGLLALASVVLNLFDVDLVDVIGKGASGAIKKIMVTVQSLLIDIITTAAAGLQVGFERAISVFQILYDFFDNLFSFIQAGFRTAIQNALSALPDFLKPDDLEVKSFADNLKDVKDAKLVDPKLLNTLNEQINKLREQQQAALQAGDEAEAEKLQKRIDRLETARTEATGRAGIEFTTFEQALEEQQAAVAEFVKNLSESANRDLSEAGDAAGRILERVKDDFAAIGKDFTPAEIFDTAEWREQAKALADSLNIPLEAVEAAAKKTAGAFIEAVSEAGLKTAASRAPDADQFAKIGLFASGGAANAISNHLANVANYSRRTAETLAKGVKISALPDNVTLIQVGA